MENEKKITNKRDLAIRLSHGGVNIKLLSKRLIKTSNMWICSKKVVLKDGYLILI